MAIGDKYSALMESDKGIAGGVASLGVDGKLSEDQRPEYTAEDVGAATVKNWTITVQNSAWIANSDTMQSGAYKAQIIADGMTAETEISIINFISGDFKSASEWSDYEIGEGIITLFSEEIPEESFIFLPLSL